VHRQSANRVRNENEGEIYRIIKRGNSVMLDSNVQELLAIGASVSANCHPCVKYHIAKAREMKIDESEIQQAVDVGKIVRKGAASQMDELLKELSK
jgi:AhpD family alkylhydroperoxidase